MDRLNIFGLIFIAIIMIPNIIYAIKCKDGFMIINIPGTGIIDSAICTVFI